MTNTSETRHHSRKPQPSLIHPHDIESSLRIYKSTTILACNIRRGKSPLVDIASWCYILNIYFWYQSLKNFFLPAKNYSVSIYSLTFPSESCSNWGVSCWSFVTRVCSFFFDLHPLWLWRIYSPITSIDRERQSGFLNNSTTACGNLSSKFFFSEKKKRDWLSSLLQASVLWNLLRIN